MSWSISAATAVAVADVESKIAEGVAAYQASLGGVDVELDPAAKEQIDAAAAAAKAIVDSGTVGSGLVTVSISGHANPGHKPVKGWSNDCVTVYVICADPIPTA